MNQPCLLEIAPWLSLVVETPKKIEMLISALKVQRANQRNSSPTRNTSTNVHPNVTLGGGGSLVDEIYKSIGSSMTELNSKLKTIVDAQHMSTELDELFNKDWRNILLEVLTLIKKITVPHNEQDLNYFESDCNKLRTFINHFYHVCQRLAIVLLSRDEERYRNGNTSEPIVDKRQYLLVKQKVALPSDKLKSQSDNTRINLNVQDNVVSSDESSKILPHRTTQRRLSLPDNILVSARVNAKEQEEEDNDQANSEDSLDTIHIPNSLSPSSSTSSFSPSVSPSSSVRSNMPRHVADASSRLPKPMSKSDGNQLKADKYTKQSSSRTSKNSNSTGAIHSVIDKNDFIDTLCKHCWNGDIDGVDNLVSLSFSTQFINHTNDRKQTPLYCASRNGHADVVKKLLIQYGSVIDVNIKCGADGGTALHAASFYSHPNVLSLLLTFGADTTAINSNGLTPYAEAQTGSLKVWKIWQSSGAKGLSESKYQVFFKVNQLTKKSGNSKEELSDFKIDVDHSSNTLTSNSVPGKNGVVEPLTFKKLVSCSDDFNTKFCKYPIQSNLIKVIAKSDKKKQQSILKHALMTRIIVHKSVLLLIDEFLSIKRECGSSIEKDLYKSMTSHQMIDRLLKKRPYVFYMPCDYTKLRSGQIIETCTDWYQVGTDNEGAISLYEYLSYDEIQISALLGVSSPTFFINDGARNNKGVPSNGKFQKEGILVGLVGPRFEKLDRMESLHILALKDTTIPENGYGPFNNPSRDVKSQSSRLLEMWAKFYGEGDGLRYFFPSFQQLESLYQMKEEAKTEGKNTSPSSGGYISPRDKPKVQDKYFKLHLDNEVAYFNIDVYKKRIQISIDTFLLDAQDRALTLKKNAYVHIVGIGLGAWKVCNEQETWFLDCMFNSLTTLKLNMISHVDFSWFTSNVCGLYKSGDYIQFPNGNNIKIIFSKRNIADKLNTPDTKSKLLVACYAWDGNSFPGNEYWNNFLDTSGDPAAAACSTISELQNPYVNLHLLSKNKFVADTDINRY
eukprot:TRINITY_DN2876_c0_g1_i1.p1 TRINITY_DN2876_c0_g1~~TRINITY_DN2876_c0_g1_i1.p1  ORF type:complete len:1015 (+),score=248.67 TRINITY_DN2876_c0_g1_i1:2228-5272(+)